MAFGVVDGYFLQWFLLIAFCEFCFLLGIIIESFKAFDNGGTIEMRFKKTSWKFWGSIDFKIQAFNQIPFGLLGNIPNAQWLRFLVLFKILRIRLFLRIFEYNNYHQFFKSLFQLRMRYIKEDGFDEDDQRLIIDHIKIFQLILFQNIFKVFGYIINMALICWLAGVVFYFLIVYVNLVNDDEGICENQNFLDFEFKDEGRCIRNQSILDRSILLLYFMSTTMSTVGLGDFRPYSDFERVIILPFFLFGLLIFSYMNNEMLEITFGIKEQLSDVQDINGLQSFISMLRRNFNNGKQLQNNFEDKMSKFFEY